MDLEVRTASENSRITGDSKSPSLSLPIDGVDCDCAILDYHLVWAGDRNWTLFDDERSCNSMQDCGKVLGWLRHLES